MFTPATSRPMITRTRAAAFVGAMSLLASAGLACPAPQGDADPRVQPTTCRCPEASAQHERPEVEIVFVLDTTGSMGGLIEGAKQKIWSIASAVAGAQPAPIVRMGLVGYRDRTDDYITRSTDLTDDLDKIYTELMSFQARGGGDTPESVNEALFHAVERTAWSDEDNVLRIVYLVGDAPPHMDYEDDVKYRASCKLAAERGILINSIQCGNLHGTEPVWREIAQHAGGSYFKVDQSGGAVVIETPYDQQIAQLNTEYMQTMLDYGDATARRSQAALRDRAEEIDAAAPGEAKADRAMYNQTAAGLRNAVGTSELIHDLDSEIVVFAEIKPEHLPAKLQGLTQTEQLAIIDEHRTRRAMLSAQIKELGEKRAQHIRDARTEAGEDGFDREMLDALRRQAKTKGIELDA